MKAMIVIDIPNDYGDVNDNRAIVTLRNGKLGTSLGIYNVPLRPLPSFKAVDLNDSRDVVMFCHGWNTCLAEMTGETE